MAHTGSLIRKIKVNGKTYEIHDAEAVHSVTASNHSIVVDGNTIMSNIVDTNSTQTLSNKTLDSTVIGTTNNDATDSSTQVATNQFVQNAIAQAQTGAATFKGTLTKDDGQPDHQLPATGSQPGWYWVVETPGTYAGQVCEAGDFVYCVQEYDPSHSASGSTAWYDDYKVVQANIDISTLDGRYARLDANNTFTANSNNTFAAGTTLTNNGTTALVGQTNLNGDVTAAAGHTVTFNGTTYAVTPSSSSNDRTVATTAFVQSLIANDKIRDYEIISETYSSLSLGGEATVTNASSIRNAYSGNKLPILIANLSQISQVVAIPIYHDSNSSPSSYYGSAGVYVSGTGGVKKPVTVYVTGNSSSFKIHLSNTATEFTMTTAYDGTEQLLTITHSGSHTESNV